jgi:hypothetical protein
VFKKITSNKTKLKRLFSKAPFTDSIKQILHYSLDHDGHLKPGSLISMIGYFPSDHLFKKIGFPVGDRDRHYLISVLSLADECEFGGYIRFLVNNKMHIRTSPTEQIKSDDYRIIAEAINTQLLNLQSTLGCNRVVFGFEIPGHSMIAYIKHKQLVIFDTNSRSKAPSWEKYWAVYTRHENIPANISNFVKHLISFGNIDTVSINNNESFDDQDFPVEIIPVGGLCPSFQGRTGALQRKFRSDAVTSDGIDMFPHGYCLPWAYMVIAMNMTYGDAADGMLQDFLSKVIYTEYEREDVYLINLLIIHLISVYLTELVTNTVP